MDTNHHRVNILESQLVSVIETKEVDLTLAGEIAVERTTTPSASDEVVLGYYMHPKIEGISAGNVVISPADGCVYVQAEISLKKFLKPQLSLSSAHVAVLIHHTRLLIKRIRVRTIQGEAISWKLDRVQRRIKTESSVLLSLESCVGLMKQISLIIEKLTKLSIEVIQEEAEYYRAIGRWEYARRAYLTWHSVVTLRFEDLQNFLGVMQQVKDWRGCLSVLEESYEQYHPETGAKLACAASILCRDVLLDLPKALLFIDKAISLQPSSEHYLALKETLIERQQQSIELDLKDSANTSTIELNEDPIIYESNLEETDADAFFDDLSITMEELKPVSDEPTEFEALNTENSSLSEEESTASLEEESDESFTDLKANPAATASTLPNRSRTKSPKNKESRQRKSRRTRPNKKQKKKKGRRK